MTYNVFGGTLNLAQSNLSSFVMCGLVAQLILARHHCI